MPLGDPQGGLFEYTVEGLPESVFAATIPVSDIDVSLEFYTGLLGMRLLGRTDSEAYVSRGSCVLVLRVSEVVGVDTGLFLGVDSPYNTRRRLMDEGVEFAVDPVRGPMGTYTSMLDPDGNVISVIETQAEFKI